MPTPASEIKASLRERTRIVRDTQREITRLLQLAATQIATRLANQPSDYQSWYLPQLAAEVQRVMTDAGVDLAEAVDVAQIAAWNAGEAMTPAVLRAADIDVVLPRINTRQLDAMRDFTTAKIKDVSLAQVEKINTQIGLVVIGSQSPFDAIKAVQKVLKEDTVKRAGSIVRDNLATAYAVANEASQVQAALQVPGLSKKWVKSGKTNPRLSHLAINGQVQPVGKPFLLEGGKVKMMMPHDPKAPLGHRINCGCVSVPVLPADNDYGFKSTLPPPADPPATIRNGVVVR